MSSPIRFPVSGAFALLLSTAALLGPSGPATSAPNEEEIDLTVAEGKGFTNSVGMTMKRIPKGKFMMGSPQNEPERGPNETQHEVTLTKDFFLSATEVTQKQYRAVMGTNPSGFSRTGGNAVSVRDVKDADLDDFPVETVSWNDTQEFLKKLNARAQERAHSRTYRLPSEAEWEYCSRAGTTTAFFTGAKLISQQSNVTEGKALGRTCKVASYPANQFGIHDMNGNVWEWCDDWFADNYYTLSPKLDPRGPQAGSGRVARGGSYAFSPGGCRSAHRASGSVTERHSGLGFRVACVMGR